MPGRWLGVIWLTPLFLLPQRQPGHGEIWFTLLDVGQGLSALVRTQHRAVLYDTGPQFGPNFDAGRSVIVPFLRHSGVGSIDTMVLSHGDTDHVGGLRSLLDTIPVKQIIGYAPADVTERVDHTEPCHEGQHWRWDGIDFRMLHPPVGAGGETNDESCVLRVSGPGGALLLTGDIEKGAERVLVQSQSKRLSSEILVGTTPRE